MTQLADSPCVARDKDAPGVQQAELPELLRQIPEWRIQVSDDMQQLTRHFRFSNFVDALAFTNAIGALAEQEGHHPALLTEWGSVRVTWWTHDIKGLHRNDFILAARTERLFASHGGS